MGSDMCVYEGFREGDCWTSNEKEIWYWRNNHVVNEWIRRRAKVDKYIYGFEYELSLKDIEALHCDLKEHQMPINRRDYGKLEDGSPVSYYMHRTRTFKFIYKAKRKLKQGKRLFYVGA